MQEFYNKTVTIFNKMPSNDVMGTDTWYKCVLTDARVLLGKGANMTQNGIADADSARLHLLIDHFLNPKEWAQKPDKTGFFTVGQDDFFVVGDVSSVQYTGDPFEWFKAHYDHVYRMVSYDEWVLIPHLEVRGR